VLGVKLVESLYREDLVLALVVHDTIQFTAYHQVHIVSQFKLPIPAIASLVMFPYNIYPYIHAPATACSFDAIKLRLHHQIHIISQPRLHVCNLTSPFDVTVRNPCLVSHNPCTGHSMPVCGKGF